ncbi:MAG: RNA polymerase sigma factor [Saprospiraceae bacterium]|nr:RNA polymerase sigma factor [Saprospiraceae bacterium]
MQLKKFEAIIQEVQDPMFRMAMSFTGDVNSAKDIVQEVIIKLWKDKDKLEEIQNMKAWSLRITRNLCIDRKRKNRVVPAELDSAFYVESDNPTPERETILEDQMNLVSKALEGLNDKQRMAMILREVEGHTYQEIADLMSENINQVKILIHRGRQNLKSFIQKENEYGIIG